MTQRPVSAISSQSFVAPLASLKTFKAARESQGLTLCGDALATEHCGQMRITIRKRLREFAQLHFDAAKKLYPHTGA